MDPHKILILVENLDINNTSSGIGRSKLIASLAEGQHKLHVMHPESSNSFPWLENVPTTQIKTEPLTAQQKIVRYIPKLRGIETYFTGYSVFFNNLKKSWKKAIESELKRNEYDLIFALGTGMSFAPHLALAELNINIPWIANVHDPYPPSLHPAPFTERESHIFKKQEKHFRQMIKKASLVSLPSLRLAEWMGAFYPEIKNKSFILPHPGKDLPNLPDSDNDKLININTSFFNLTHAGSLLGPRNPVNLLKAFRNFILSDEEKRRLARLNIIGRVADKIKNFDADFSDLEENVRIIKKRISYKHSIEILKNSDVLIVLEAPSKDSPFMPGKLADYIHSGKPVFALTPPESETARLLGKEYPFICETDNIHKIEKLLNLLWREWKNKGLNKYTHNELKNYIAPGNINRVFDTHIKTIT